MGELSEARVLLLDCQTTGASPSRGALLEIGWAEADGRSEELARAPEAHVAAQPGRARVPRRVRELTGITAAEVRRSGVAPEAIWAALMEAAGRLGEGPTPVVIHYARFERPFLEQLHAAHGEGPWPFRLICTHAIAQRLFPGLPRRGIRALAGYLGHDKPELKRAAGHVAATAAIWAGLTEVLEEEHGVGSLAELGEWLERTPVVRGAKREYPIARDKRLSLPRRPGVYRMLDRNQRVLYVGKATSLRQRVNSYFRKGRGASERHLELVTRIWDVEVTPTASPLEAALMETDAIKAHDPPYNIALKEVGREVAFVSPDLRSASGAPSATHCLGPLPGAASAHAVAALVRVLGEGGEEEVLEQAQALLIPVERLPPMEIALEGFERVRARYGLGGRERVSVRSLLGIGARLHVEALAARASAAEGEPDEESAEGSEEGERDRSWTAEDVEQAVLTGLMLHGRLLRRASWLCQLSEATVAWRPTHEEGAGWRCLAVEGGEVAFSRALGEGESPEAPVGGGRSFGERQRRFDVATYDRLRVLTTELRRVLSSGGEASVWLGGRVRVEAAALARLLSWV